MKMQLPEALVIAKENGRWLGKPAQYQGVTLHTCRFKNCRASLIISEENGNICGSSLDTKCGNWVAHPHNGKTY
jgi:hypothetical protein